MRKFARSCDGVGARDGLVCDARCARFRTLADRYLCESCYQQWLARSVESVDAGSQVRDSREAGINLRVIREYRPESDRGW